MCSNGKGNKQRIVYIDARSKLHLQNYLAKRKDTNSALFVSLHSPHQRMSINGIENRLKSLGKKARVAKVYPHKFRRTLATNAIDIKECQLNKFKNYLDMKE